MPKGGLLHVHLDATVNAATLLKLALKQPAIHIRVKNAIDAHNISTTLPEFCALPPGQYNEESTLSGESYVPYTWVAIRRARENFSPTLGGPSAFDQWVVDAMMIHPSEAYGSHNTVKKVFGFSVITKAIAKLAKLDLEQISNGFQGLTGDGHCLRIDKYHTILVAMLRACSTTHPSMPRTSGSSFGPRSRMAFLMSKYALILCQGTVHCSKLPSFLTCVQIHGWR